MSDNIEFISPDAGDTSIPGGSNDRGDTNTVSAGKLPETDIPAQQKPKLSRANADRYKPFAW